MGITESVADPHGRDRFLERHPCFSGKAHLKYGRIHLPGKPGLQYRMPFLCQGIRSGGDERDEVPGVASRGCLAPRSPLCARKGAFYMPPRYQSASAGPGTARRRYSVETLALAKGKSPGSSPVSQLRTRPG